MTGVRNISPYDRILYLKALPTIGELTSQQVARLAGEADEVNFDAGDKLLTRGEVSRCFYVVASGTVKLSRSEGHEQLASAPDTIGFVEMFAEDTQANATAMSDVVTLKFDLTNILEVFEEDFELLQNTLRSVARAQLALLMRMIGGTRRAPWKPVVEVSHDRELDLLERLIMIRQGDLFTAVGLEAGVMMATSMKQVSWSPGEVLWEPGDPSGSMFIIIDGEIDAQLEDGQSFEAGLGYPVGNLESLAHMPRWYRPVAKTDVVALRADHETFFDVMEDDFEVAEAFLKAMSHGILSAQDSFVARGKTYPRPGQPDR